MRLADLRRFSIRQQTTIRFRLRNGMECVVTTHGVAEIPELKGIPDFNLEEELASATAFLLESPSPDRKTAPKPRNLTGPELAALLSAGPAPGSAPDHDDE
jgi:hypothetical protein